MEPSRKLTRKDLAMYALGYILLAYVAFVERDLTNRADFMEGVVVFGRFVFAAGRPDTAPFERVPLPI